MPNTTNEAEIQIVQTAGEILADGAAIELVAPLGADTPQLLKWDGKEALIAPQVEYKGRIFRPVSLPASVLKATRLPTGAVDFGAPEKLLVETQSLFEKYLGYSPEDAAALAAWAASTWFADLVSSPCTLFLRGFEMSQAINLFRLLACTCRHPMLLAEMTRSALCSLMALRPTLLLNQPQVSPRLLDLLCTANYMGVTVPASKGAIVDLVGSRAIFLGMDGAAIKWGNEGLHLGVPPARSDLLPLHEEAQVQISDWFQPQYLMLRLRRSHEVRQSRFAEADSPSPASELVRTLQICAPAGSEFRMQWRPLVEFQEQAARAERACDPGAGMLEVMWPRLHANEREISMQDLTEFTNTLLFARGEVREYSSEEIGKKMQNLGLPRHRKSSGMVFIFNRATNRRLHMLAKSFGVCTRVEGCSDCETAQIVKEQVM